MEIDDKDIMKTLLFTLITLITCFLACSKNDVTGPLNTAPSIEDQLFEITENANIGTIIGTILATDLDEDTLSFEILEGNLENVFTLNSSTGELSLSQSLNIEVTESYVLLVQVTDDIASAQANITISIKPIEVIISIPGFPGNSFFDGRLGDADYWSDQPKILSAGLGFSDILGIEVDEITEELVERIGGAWASNISCEDTRSRTFTSTRDDIELVFVVQNPYADDFKEGALGLDALPMVFTWPVKTNTIDLSDFRITVSNGDEITPSAAGVAPNFEINERNVVVLSGEFANKLPSSDPNSRFVTKVEVVGELILVGPNGQEFNAQGMYKETLSSPYDANNGPRLVGAKLNYSDPNVAEGFSINLPFPRPDNDEFALYSEQIEEAEAEGKIVGRLRVLTSGGFSPNGIQGVLPTDFDKFFRVHAHGTDGSTVLVEQVNKEYEVQGGIIKVIGLADLGLAEGVNDTIYDGCYQEDGDNYIDIIIVGDDAALRNLTHVEIPSLAGGYSAFFNPGGPGPTPYAGARYTAPGPYDLEPVIMALDNPMRISN